MCAIHQVDIAGPMPKDFRGACISAMSLAILSSRVSGASWIDAERLLRLIWRRYFIHHFFGKQKRGYGRETATETCLVEMVALHWHQSRPKVDAGRVMQVHPHLIDDGYAPHNMRSQ